jgi:hypothetical protein
LADQKHNHGGSQ